LTRALVEYRKDFEETKLLVNVLLFVCLNNIVKQVVVFLIKKRILIFFKKLDQKIRKNRISLYN